MLTKRIVSVMVVMIGLVLSACGRNSECQDIQLVNPDTGTTNTVCVIPVPKR